MKPYSSWPTAPQLQQVAGEFEHGRQHRSQPGERIPKHLGEHAGTLARLLPRSRGAQHLRLAPSDRNKHIAMHNGSLPAPPATPARFVEVPPPTLPPAPATRELELERPDGARLRLRGPESTWPVAALVRAFWEECVSPPRRGAHRAYPDRIPDNVAPLQAPRGGTRAVSLALLAQP